MLLKRFILSCFTVCTLLTASVAVAQPSGADGDDFIYTVRSGDTLSELSQRYTGTSVHWPTLQNLNNVTDPLTLPIGKSLRIPFSIIAEIPGEAKISYMRGEVTVNGQPPLPDMLLKEGDEVVVGTQAFLTLQLSDGSTITVPPSSTVNVKRLRDFQYAPLTDSILELPAGELETRVAPDHRGVGRFEVHTPVSITGVRGTDLRVRRINDSSFTEVISGKAKLQTDKDKSLYVQRDQGTVITASGEISISSLLPAPNISMPTFGTNGWQVSFPALPGAAQYLVQVTLDEEGTELYSRQYTTNTLVYFHAGGSGTHYVRVRGVTADGMMGRDAVASFPGQPVLRSSDGLPVMSGFELPIILQP